ncbi:MAG: hypothetical protein JWQ87_3030 [Candidatus Sulfotelmatobacter sp.]|nr:hypothetical protein [Candidatus Sulfotelmatobacter sp.]
MENITSAKLFERLRLLWDDRRVIGKVTLTGLVLGAILAFLLPKQYQSTAQLMPPDTRSASATMLATLGAKAGSGLGAMAGDLLGSNSSGALFVGVLRSRTLEDRLVERFDLKKVYGERLEEDARSRLSNNTGVSEDHKSGIISIRVVDHDPGRAAALAEAHVEELNRLVSELSTSAAHRERIFLEERLKTVKQELDQASREFSQFASKNSAIDIPEQGKAMVEAAALLQGQMIAAESELKGLAEIYTANNVRVRSVQARVSELRRQLEKLNGYSAVGKDASVAIGNPDYPTIRELPLLGVTYADLLRRTKIQEAVYVTLTEQYELARVQEAKETPSVKVLDMASVPERKVFPPRLLIMVCGGLIGLAGAALAAIERRRWQQLDSRNPGKMLAHEVFHAVNAAMPWSPPNGSYTHAVTNRLWVRFAKPNPSGSRDEVMPSN